MYHGVVILCFGEVISNVSYFHMVVIENELLLIFLFKF